MVQLFYDKKNIKGDAYYNALPFIFFMRTNLDRSRGEDDIISRRLFLKMGLMIFTLTDFSCC